MVSAGFDPILPVPVGPIESYIYGLSAELSRRHFVDVIGYGRDRATGQDINITAILGKSKVVSLFEKSIGREYGHALSYNIHVFQRLFALHRKHPIQLLHINTIYSGPVASFFKCLYDVPIVCSLHNTVRTTLPIRMCDRIIANSQFVKSYLVDRHGLSPKIIEVLPVAIDISLYSPLTKKKAKEKLRLSGRKIVLFVGRKCYQKGPQVLMDAMSEVVKRCPRTQAIFVGPDYAFGLNSTSFTNFLKAKARKLEIEDNVAFVGFTQGLALRMYLYAADVLVCPSLYNEAFGRIIVESMASRTPVIASEVGGLPELIRHNENGLLVPANNPELLSEAIARLLNDSNLAHRLADNGRKFVEDGYSFGSVASRCLRIYEELG